MTLKSFFNAPDTPVVQQWEEHLDAQAWDRRYPGILDFVTVLAGAANVIMQLSWPQVGYGVKESRVDSGSILKHPVKRTRTTLSYIAVAMTGSAEEKKAYRTAVNGAHAQVYSTDTSPVKYHAMDPGLQLWVALCLYKGFIDAHQHLRQCPQIAHDETFYRLAQPLGTTLQVRADMWPDNLDEFNALWEAGLAKAHIDDTMREYLHSLTALKYMNPIIRGLFGRFNVFMTTGFLPASLRQQMHYDWNDAQQQRFELTLRWIGRLNRLLPRVIRQVSIIGLMWDVRRRLRLKKPLI